MYLRTGILHAGFHHRNPSGFRNKIRWFLSKSLKDLNKLKFIYKYLAVDRMSIYEKFSWDTAYIVAEYICLKTKRGANMPNYRKHYDFINTLDIRPIYKICKDMCEYHKKPIDPYILNHDVIKMQIDDAYRNFHLKKNDEGV